MKITRFDHIGRILDQLQEWYAAGQLETVVVSVLKKDNTIDHLWNEAPYLERLGLVAECQQEMWHWELEDQN